MHIFRIALGNSQDFHTRKISWNIGILHCVKNVRIWSYSGLHFPAFGLNMEIYSVSLRIQSKYGKMRTRITPNTDTFYAVLCSDGILLQTNFPRAWSLRKIGNDNMTWYTPMIWKLSKVLIQEFWIIAMMSLTRFR